MKKNTLHRLFFLFLTAAFAGACSSPGKGDVQVESNDFPSRFSVTADTLFTHRGLTGTFLLGNLNGSRTFVYNSGRASEVFLPASTFSVMAALIYLQEGIVSDTQRLAWDGKDRGWDEINRELTLGEALKFSADHVFENLAERTGKARIQYWLTRTGYGNALASGKTRDFWMKGDLRITPRQQLDFLKKLYRRELPFDRGIQDKVLAMMLREENGRYSYYYKTGWARAASPDIVWNMGIVRTGEDVYFYVLNLEVQNDEEGEYRKTIPELLLRDFGILPGHMGEFIDSTL